MAYFYDKKWENVLPILPIHTCSKLVVISKEIIFYSDVLN